jgi:hypothetical protein
MREGGRESERKREMMYLFCVDALVKCLVPGMIPYSFWPFPRTMVLVQNAKGVLALQQRTYFKELFIYFAELHWGEAGYGLVGEGAELFETGGPRGCRNMHESLHVNQPAPGT